MIAITYYEPRLRKEITRVLKTEETIFNIFQKLTGFNHRDMKSLKELYYSCGCHVTYQDALYGNIEMKEIY